MKVLTYLDEDYELELEKFSAPMPWVGVYIAAASLVCTLTMAADVIHGFRHKKLWFPCKYFTLNAASLTFMAIAMKLPVDLNNPMPRAADQAAKISSNAFMCILMANFLPSLGPMNGRDLFLNITALGILVITIVVNVCIQLSTGLIITFFLQGVFISFMLYLLTLFASSALMLPISKRILQYKYREMLKTSFPEESQCTGTLCTVEKLIYDVSKHWIMAETSNPQFVLACSPTCSASGAICVIAAIFSLLINVPYSFSDDDSYSSYYSYSVYQTPSGQKGASDYKWSIFPIITVQLIGVVVGTIAPFFRLFRAFSFKLSLNHSKKYLKVCQTEKYWTQMLVDWKSSRVSLQIGRRKCQKAIHVFKNLLVNSMIQIQIFVVILSKLTQLVTIFLVIMVYNCWYCCTWLVGKLMATTCASKCHEGLESVHHEGREMTDLSRYVLQLEDEVEIASRTIARIFKSVHQLIKEAEKKHPNNLMKLLEKSTGFEGLEKIQNNQVPSLRSSNHPNSWSLVVATLSSIAMALQTQKNGKDESLLSGISEGLQLVRLIEESLDPIDENLVNVRKAAGYVWLQVEIYYRWMDEDLQNKALRGKTAVEIITSLGDKAQKILMECENSMYLGSADSSFQKVVAANSMYKISQSILLDLEGSEGLTDEMLFDKVCVMIADILSACLSNIPSVIARKCDGNDIRKREENVKFAARLVGQTKEIMKFLQQRQLPSMEPDKLGYIDEWHAFFNPSSNSETVSSTSSQLLSIGVE